MRNLAVASGSLLARQWGGHASRLDCGLLLSWLLAARLPSLPVPAWGDVCMPLPVVPFLCWSPSCGSEGSEIG
eukprot:scaffold3139_cov110-Isochrysis_galbana.AAC.1